MLHQWRALAYLQDGNTLEFDYQRRQIIDSETLVRNGRKDSAIIDCLLNQSHQDSLSLFTAQFSQYRRDVNTSVAVTVIL